MDSRIFEHRWPSKYLELAAERVRRYLSFAAGEARRVKRAERRTVFVPAKIGPRPLPYRADRRNLKIRGIRLPVKQHV